MVEIFYFKINDLLREPDDPACDLEITQDSFGLVTVKNVKEKYFIDFIQNGPKELIQIFDKGKYRRVMRTTYENETSSRSIMVSTLRIKKQNKETGKITSCGKLTFVDLAGSESLA